MTFIKTLVLYGVMAVVFFSLDMIWIGVVAKDFYNRNLKYHLTPDVNWQAALLFYAIFLIGIEVFVVLPGVERAALGEGLLRAGLLRTGMMGVLFGVVTYSAFDLTCGALFKEWPMIVSWVDMAWGGVLTGSVSTLGYLFATRFLMKG